MVCVDVSVGTLIELLLSAVDKWIFEVFSVGAVLGRGAFAPVVWSFLRRSEIIFSLLVFLGILFLEYGIT